MLLVVSGASARNLTASAPSAPPSPGILVASSTATPTTDATIAPTPTATPTLPPTPAPVEKDAWAGPFADIPTPHQSYDDWQITLVDKWLTLPADYVPPDLEYTGNGGQLRAFVLPDLRAMLRAAPENLLIESGYRSYYDQIDAFNNWEAQAGLDRALMVSARPGHSEHQLGTAFDLQRADGPFPWLENFGWTTVGEWLAIHSWEYGFIQSYPAGKSDATYYAYEPWHYRYVGREEATAIHYSGLTTREWLLRYPLGLRSGGRGPGK